MLNKPSTGIKYKRPNMKLFSCLLILALVAPKGTNCLFGERLSYAQDSSDISNASNASNEQQSSVPMLAAGQDDEQDRLSTAHDIMRTMYSYFNLANQAPALVVRKKVFKALKKPKHKIGLKNMFVKDLIKLAAEEPEQYNEKKPARGSNSVNNLSWNYGDLFKPIDMEVLKHLHPFYARPPPRYGKRMVSI